MEVSSSAAAAAAATQGANDVPCLNEDRPGLSPEKHAKLKTEECPAGSLPQDSSSRSDQEHELRLQRALVARMQK
jgi:hypothetical protein